MEKEESFEVLSSIEESKRKLDEITKELVTFSSTNTKLLEFSEKLALLCNTLNEIGSFEKEIVEKVILVLQILEVVVCFFPLYNTKAVII